MSFAVPPMDSTTPARPQSETFAPLLSRPGISLPVATSQGFQKDTVRHTLVVPPGPAPMA